MTDPRRTDFESALAQDEPTRVDMDAFSTPRRRLAWELRWLHEYAWLVAEQVRACKSGGWWQRRLENDDE